MNRKLLTSIAMLAVIIFVLASSAFAQNIIVNPEPSDELFANPGMGWQTFNRFADEDPNLAGLPSGSAYFRLYWSEVESEDGMIDFAMFDEMLAHAHRAGQKLAFRIMCAGTDNDYMHVPAWLKENGCPGWEYSYGESEVKHWVPDMDSAEFKHAHYRLIRELGARYDGHPDLDALDIGTVGLWAEWHMSGTGLDMPSETTCIEIIDEWCDAFPTTPKVMLIGYEKGMLHAVERGCGWRADCLGDMGGFSDTWNHMENMYPQRIEETAKDAWMRGPVAWESCWTMQKWAQEDWCIPCIFSYALDYHGSYLNNKSAAIPEGSRKEIENLLMKLGYRLSIHRFTCPKNLLKGETFDVNIIWENSGVAPPYRDYRLAIRLKNNTTAATEVLLTDASYRYWQPGKFSVTISPQIPENLSGGSYEIAVGLVDAQKRPQVKLAVDGGEGMWYPMADVTLK